MAKGPLAGYGHKQYAQQNGTFAAYHPTASVFSLN